MNYEVEIQEGLKLTMESWSDRLEITTKIGCPIGCLRYCPQEVTMKRYSDKEKVLSMDSFKKILNHTPSNVEIIFSGFCEPFANKNCMDMIDLAFENGHCVSIFTTLYQASFEQVQRLIQYKYRIFCLHLPDGKAMKIPITQEYMNNVFCILQNIRNVEFSIMNDKFFSFGREKFVRGLYTKTKRIGFCPNFKNPDFVVLPNGDVYLCCMDFGLWHKMGNLLHESYVSIKQRYMFYPKNYRLCSFCGFNIPIYKKWLRSMLHLLKQREMKRKET